jgi:hypothetical protein
MPEADSTQIFAKSIDAQQTRITSGAASETNGKNGAFIPAIAHSGVIQHYCTATMQQQARQQTTCGY